MTAMEGGNAIELPGAILAQCNYRDLAFMHKYYGKA